MDVLIWTAMGPRGLSQPFIAPSNQAINQHIYLKECVKKRLMPYISAKYTNYVFWPDQASSHYATTVVEHLRKEGIHFVEKVDNPANLPEARPVEDFWAALKGMVYAKGWHAENVQQLVNRIKYCLRNINPKLVQRLGEATKKKIDKIRRNGVVESK
uniref:Transposase n=1 Tax=Acrobeloides nanus TaxID=290746 RepID=A0A914DHW9_9BILA